jgi:hypothetical protein
MATLLEWLKCTAAVFSRRKSPSDRLEQATFPRVYDSQLEDRRVLNAGAVVTAIDLVSLRFDAGQSVNDGLSDKFELARLDSSTTTNQIAVSINNQRVWQGNASDIHSIHFHGSRDQDQFYIDPTIQVGAGVFINGTGAAIGSSTQTSSDFIQFTAPSNANFEVVTYQTRDNLTQVRFVSTSQQLNTVVQFQNVAAIQDLNLALDRSFIVDSAGGRFSLKDSVHTEFASSNQTAQWTSDQSVIEFQTPSRRLAVDLRSTLTGKDTLTVDSFQHSGLKQFEVLADHTDSIHVKGAIHAGNSISIHAGTIDIEGDLATAAPGVIRLDAGSGILRINGDVTSRGDDSQRGGDVTLVGDRVLLEGITRVDVSGGTGGGRIRVGGGYQGKDASLHNARYTSVSHNTTLIADARIHGDGGMVIVWSDDTSHIDGSGNIFARGGIDGGDGGFVETSGKKYLRIDGAASTFASKGQAGTWLIDPNDIEIVAALGGASPNTSYVLISTIIAGLANGNMTIVTDTPSAGSGDIRIVDALNLAPSSSRILTLDATRDIVFLSGLTGNSNLQVNLVAGRDVNSTAVSIGQLAALTIDARRNISLGTVNLAGGTLTANVDTNNDDNNATFQSTGALSAGAMSINGSTAANDNITLGSTATTTTGAIQFSQINNLTFQGDVTAATNITFSNIAGSLALGSNVDVTANNGPIDFSTITSGIQLTGSNGSTNILTANGATGNLTLGPVTTTNSSVGLTLSSTTNTTVGSIALQNGTLTVTIDTDNNNAGSTFQSTGALSAGAMSISGSAAANDNITLGSTATTTTGAIQFSQINNLTFQGDVTAATNITFSNIAGSLALGSNVDVTANNGPIDFSTITSGIQLTGSNGSTNILTANGATGNLTLGPVTTTNSSVGLTLSSTTNTTVGSIALQNGTLTVTIDTDNNNAGSTFQSTGALSAGAMSISGSAAANDNITLGSTATTTTGAIQFSQINNLTFQGDVTAATNITFSNIAGSLALGSNVDVTANNGPIDFSTITSGIQLTGSNGSTNILTANGATGNLTLGPVTTTNSSVGLTLSSTTNTTVGSIALQNGTLTVTIDTDNNNAGSTFQSTGALSAGAMSISGSAAANDNITLGSTATTTTGAIQFSQINNLTFQGDVTAATNITFSNIAGSLALGSNVDVTANNGPIDFSTITSGIQLTGSNGSSNILTANGATGSIILAAITATNANVSLTLDSATDVEAEDINIQNGNLVVSFSGQNVATANVADFKKVTAATFTVSGNSRSDDQTIFNDTLTIGAGGVTVEQFSDLEINGSISSVGEVTITGDPGSQTLLAADVTTNGGDITITGGTLLVDGSAARTIASGGGGVAGGGNIVLGNIDGANGAADLTVDSRGAATAGSVTVGTVTATNSGLNRLHIRSDSTTSGQVTLSSTRLIEKTPATAASLIVAAGGSSIRASGEIDLSSNNTLDGGSIDFGSSEVTPTSASSTLNIKTSNSSSSGGNGGDIKFGGISNNSANYFDAVSIDTSAANAAKTNGDLDFGGKANPKIAVDGNTGTGISLIGTIIKAFSGILSFLTNPTGAAANSSSIDVSRADLQSTAGLAFDTSGGASTNAGDVVLGDIGVLPANRPSSLSVDTRGSVTSGDLILEDGTGTSTEIHVDGDLNLANAKIKLTDNARLHTYGTGNMTLGEVATNTAAARDLTLNSQANITVSAIDLTGGALIASFDTNDNSVGATFLSTGVLSAGTIAISGSATKDDEITIGSTLTSTTGTIQFSRSKLTFNGDVTSQTSMTFTDIVGVLSLGTNADVTANNGPLDFSTVAAGILLAGINGSSNTLTARGSTGSLTLGSVTATNNSVGLTLSSATDTVIGGIHIQNGVLIAQIDSDNNNVGSSFVSTGALNAGSISISGSTTVDDLVTLGSTVTTTNGAIQINQFEDLRINGNWTSGGGITTTGVSVSKTRLAANITSNGGSISMTGGTLLVSGATVRQIKSGGTNVSSINGGSITLGAIDGEVSVAELELDSRGTTTSGSVSLGNVTAATGNTGLNRLIITTDGASPGQVSLSSIRLIAKSGTAAFLNVNSGGTTILADGTIDLSSNANGQAGGKVDFGTSIVAPKNAGSTLTINTSNTNTTSGVDGSNGGDVLLGGIGVNSAGSNFFDSVTIDLSAADILDAAGTLKFGAVSNPTIQVDGVAGVGIRITGKIDNVAGKIVSMSTNPSAVLQNTSAIDVSKATFLGSGGLSFDTSGGNRSLNSGSVSLGDIGSIVRPVSLVIDTRGTVSSGHLILDDGVAGSDTEIRVDGTIDFSISTVELQDDVLLESLQDGNSVLLGATTASGGARNLRLASDSGITVDSIDLSGGAFQANIDANNNEAGVTFRSNGTIAAGSLTVSGSAANNDMASIGGDATTTGAVSFSNFDQLRIQGLVTAGTTFSAQNIVGAVDFSGISGITANGSIDLLTSVNAIKLSGIAGDTTLIDAKGNTSVITLATVTATNPGTRLNVRSDYSADLRNVDLLTGTLDVLIGRATTQTDATARLRQVNAGRLIVAGTSTTNDTVVLDGWLNIGADGISIQNLANLDVNFNVQSAGDIEANNIRNRIQVDEGISIQSDQGIDLQTNVASIQLVGKNGLTNLFRADGDTSSLKLASIQALHNVILVLSSANDISVDSIDALGSNLSIRIDNDDNTPGSQLDAAQIQAKQISILGGTDQNDTANLTGLVESKSGSLLVSSFGTVNLIGNLISSTSLDVSNVSGRLNIGGGRLIKAANGDTTLNNNVNEIRFLGGPGTSTSLQSVNGNLLVSALMEVNTSDQIELRADGNILLQSSNLSSRLQLIAGDHNNISGSINASGTLAAGSIALEAASGIGTTGALATSTSNLTATNRLGGVVQIANNSSGTVTISNLTANQGGNILFTQSGGGLVRFQQVTSNPDGTPTADECDIRLLNVGGGLVVEGAGITAGGVGNVVIQTQNMGDVQLLAATGSSQGTLSIQSAQRIIGSGLLSSNQVELTAVSGIGTTGAIQTQTRQLRVDTQSDSINVQNSSAALTTVRQLRSGGSGTIQFNQVGGGDVAFLDVETGVAASNAGSNVHLRNSNGSVLIQGSVVAGGGGSIRFDAQNNLVIGSGALVRTAGTSATIGGNTGGQFQFTPGATIRAGSSDANTEAVVMIMPPVVSVRPTVNSLGVNVDSEGFATLQIQLGSAGFIDRNFSVVIDWGDGQIDRFPIGSLSPLTIDPQVSRFDGSGNSYAITHQYLGNPNPTDPIADIPVKVTVGIDALNRIQFTDAQGPVKSQSTVVNEVLVTPAAGLISLRFDLPQAPTIPTRLIFSNSGQVQATNSLAPVVASAEIVISSSGSVAEKSRSYVLRVITPISEQGEVESSEDIELTLNDIEDLSTGKLFQKLGDNRYRIYLIREDGNELLLKDFYLRNHRPIEVDDTPTVPSSLPVDERVLDQQSKGASERIDRASPPATDEAEESELRLSDGEGTSDEMNEDEAVAGATIVAGTFAQTKKSWRKAARRFRAG